MSRAPAEGGSCRAPGRRRREAAAAAVGGDRDLLARGGWALVRAATSEQDAAIYPTAAFTGCGAPSSWRFAGATSTSAPVACACAVPPPGGRLTAPKSGRVRSVPLAPDVAAALARLGARERWTGDDDRVSPRECGFYLDASALFRRYKAALGARGAAATALPRPAPHLRHADDRQGRHPARAGVDGPRRRRHHDEVPALRRAPDEAAPVAEAFALEPRAIPGP